jgi:hypothetical protein
MLEDTVVTCPSCWEEIELSVDLSGGSATYTEDCPVCCQPMTVKLAIVDEDSGEFSVEVEAENG